MRSSALMSATDQQAAADADAPAYAEEPATLETCDAR
jgi:hypothetical protein